MELEGLCRVLSKELDEMTAKVEKAGGVTSADIDFIDKLTHSLKSIKTTMAMEDSSNEYDSSNRSYEGSYRSYDGSNRSYGVSYARGRGRGARRDSMGRYSSEMGYSRADEFESQLRELLQSAPDEKSRQSIKRMLEEM